MTNPPVNYVECDIPEGVTLAEYRRRPSPERGERPGLLARFTRLIRRRSGAG